MAINEIIEIAETIDTFIEAMKELPQVMECYIILGECDGLELTHGQLPIYQM